MLILKNTNIWIVAKVVSCKWDQNQNDDCDFELVILFDIHLPYNDDSHFTPSKIM